MKEIRSINELLVFTDTEYRRALRRGISVEKNRRLAEIKKISGGVSCQTPQK